MREVCVNDQQSAGVAFEIDDTYFADVTGINPDSTAWFSVCERLNLPSAERIFFALCRSMALNSHVFKPGEVIAAEGTEVHESHIVMNGYVTVTQASGKSFRVGMGGVFGLAEGVMDLPHAYTVTAQGMVTTSVMPLSRVHREMPRIHKGLQGIERCTMMRIISGSGANIVDKS
jgi:hypothetical protein